MLLLLPKLKVGCDPEEDAGGNEKGFVSDTFEAELGPSSLV